jgi:hypothetical protein
MKHPSRNAKGVKTVCSTLDVVCRVDRMYFLENRVLLATLAAVALGLGAAPAWGHGIVTIEDGQMAFRATDFVSRNAITITQTGSTISLVDSTGFGGLDPGDCRPGRVDLESGYVIEALCSRSGIETIRVNSGEREDDINVKVNLPTRIVGGGGIDTITTGTADDNISGGDGNDVINPGGGTDKVDAGQGDDTLRLKDNAPDETDCGTGNDAAEFDAFDLFAADCERAPLTALSSDADDVAPHPTVRTTTRQRWDSRLQVRATSDEPVEFVAQAAIVIGEHDFSLRPGRGRLEETVGAVELRPQMSDRVKRIVGRAIHEGRKVRLFVSVVATDRSGNSAIANAKTISLVSPNG